MIESEIKVRVDDLEPARRRLEALEAERLHPRSLERNDLFDRDGELLERGCVLRLREDGQGSTVTFKGPPEYDGLVKRRLELETAVGDAQVLRELLGSLGYARQLTYEKYREEWRLGSAVVCLDETPVGAFLEVEAEQPLAVFEELAVEHQGAESRSYVGLWMEARAHDPTLPEDMVFASELPETR